MLREWQKYIASLTDDDNESLQKEKEHIDEVQEADSLTSEDVHGGNEATKDIEGSPNSANEGNSEDKPASSTTQSNSKDETKSESEDNSNSESTESSESESNEGNGTKIETDSKNESNSGSENSSNSESVENSESESSEKNKTESRNDSENENGSMSENDSEDESENELENETETEAEFELETDSELPSDSGYPINHNSQKSNNKGNRSIKREIAVVISKIAEDAVGTKTDGDDFWDIERLMLRRITKENLNKCRNSYEKDNIVIGLDFSGSCIPYSNFFQSILEDAAGDIEIYDASNGFYEGMKSVDEKIIIKDFLKELAGRTVMFFGDFDGGDSLVGLSRVAKVYWFSCEERYDDMYEHSWCHYTLKDFKGKYYKNITEANDFIKVIKKIR